MASPEFEHELKSNREFSIALFAHQVIMKRMHAVQEFSEEEACRVASLYIYYGSKLISASGRFENDMYEFFGENEKVKQNLNGDPRLINLVTLVEDTKRGEFHDVKDQLVRDANSLGFQFLAERINLLSLASVLPENGTPFVPPHEPWDDPEVVKTYEIAKKLGRWL